MAHIKVLLPQWGMGMSEGTLVKWLKSVGDTVAEDEPLAEVEAEKSTAVIESPGRRHDHGNTGERRYDSAGAHARRHHRKGLTRMPRGGRDALDRSPQADRDARSGGYAIGAFNMHNVETTEALVRAAEQAEAPVFLQVGRAIVPHMGLRRRSK